MGPCLSTRAPGFLQNPIRKTALPQPLNLPPPIGRTHQQPIDPRQADRQLQLLHQRVRAEPPPAGVFSAEAGEGLPGPKKGDAWTGLRRFCCFFSPNKKEWNSGRWKRPVLIQARFAFSRSPILGLVFVLRSWQLPKDPGLSGRWQAQHRVQLKYRKVQQTVHTTSARCLLVVCAFAARKGKR